MRHGLARWLVLLVVTGALCVYLTGNQSVGLFDRDEPRYAQTSRQMLQSGDWVVPHFLDRVRTAKPVLIYWCQATAMKVLGDTRFAARLPSALAMTATVALLAIGIAPAAGRRRALWTAFILSSCVMAVVSAKMCLTDAVLLLLITITQLCVYRVWRYGADVPTVVVLGVAAGLAGLTKGPVALGINATTAVALLLIGRTVRVPERQRPRVGWQWKQLPLVVGLGGVLLAAVATPWLVMVQRRAPEFLSTSIGRDVVDRMQRGAEGHSGPPGTYSVVVWGTFFPWSLLLPAALIWGWRRRHVPAVRFALAAFIGPWVMFELIATKLPHYVLPTYPALAFLTADLLVRVRRGRVKDLASRGFRVTAWVWGVAVALAGLAGPVLLLWIGYNDPTAAGGALLIAAIAVAMGILTARRFAENRAAAAGRAMGGGFLAIVLVAYALVLPNFGPLRLTRDVAGIINSQGGYGQPGLMIDFKEPSLAFEQGGGLREQSNSAYLNESSPADWPTWVVLTQKVWDSTRPDVQARWDVVGSTSGLAYSDRGARHEVIVLRRRDG